MNLQPCPFRLVDDEGHILCDKIKAGERQVSPNVCRACPISALNCAHLRATLDHPARPPITVRYGNGKTEVWEDDGPPLALQRAACAEKVIPILSPRDCAGCQIRQALVAAEVIPTPTSAPIQPTRRSQPRPTPIAPRASLEQPAPAAVAQLNHEAEQQRSSLVAQKIIQLQEWLAKQKNAPAKDSGEEDDAPMPIAVGARRMQSPGRGEEKRVGWTD